ncbi:MAG: hypothetical protein HYY16_14920 [Planctomycetes bacterium]|nr:hypothetical protein [Planctomycetota bacterium]
MRTALVVLMTMSVFAAPLYADVLPSRRPVKTDDTAQVARQIVALGVDGVDARAQAEALTSSETAFFAEHPARIQVVGAQEDIFSGESDNLWYESLIGLGVLGAGLGTIGYMINHND